MQRLAVLFAACALVTLGGCGADTHDGLMTEQVNLMTELNETLDTVKDKASAEAAKSKIESIGEKMKSVEARAKAMEDPTPEAQTELLEKHQPQLAAQGMRLMGNRGRIMAIPEAAAIIESAMKDAQP